MWLCMCMWSYVYVYVELCVCGCVSELVLHKGSLERT